MKKPTNDLHELIKSLNQAEKGYFRRHTLIDTKGPETKYNMLFDAINDMELYDEKRIKDQFKEEQFTKQFAVAKTYLYNRILSSLHSYHSSDHERIRKQLHYAEILHAKGLYTQTKKIVCKAKKDVYALDLYNYLPAVLYLESRLAFQAYDLKWVARNAKEKIQCNKILQNINTYSDLCNTILVCMQEKEGLPDKERIRKIEKAIKHPLLQSASRAITMSAMLFYYNSHCFYWTYKRDPHKAKYFVKKRINILEKHPKSFKRNFHLYLSSMNNLLHFCHETKDYDGIKKYLMKIANTPPPKKLDEVYKFFVYHAHFMQNIHETGRQSEIIDSMSVINKEYFKYEHYLSNFEKTVLCMHFALIWFGARDYSKCLKYLNKIKNELSIATHPNIDSFLNLFYIIVHYEIKHWDLLPYQLKSTYRLLDGQGKLNKFQKIFLSFFKTQLTESTNHKERIELFKKLKKDLLPLTKDKNEKQNFEFFDFIAWADSKIKNRPFAEVVRRKIADTDGQKDLARS